MDVVNRKNKWKVILPEKQPGSDGNQQAEKQERVWTPNQELCRIAVFPDCYLRNTELFSSGPIVLRYGRHLGPNRGFGFEHIWKEHGGAYPDHDEAMEKVEARVREVIRPGAEIFYEAGSRAAIFSSIRGMAIVERKPDGNNASIYSVVTVYKPRKVNGSRVGAVE